VRTRTQAGADRELVGTRAPDDSATFGGNVNGAESAHVTADAIQRAPLMRTVIDLDPGDSAVR
jgi:hypothetical protein